MGKVTKKKVVSVNFIRSVFYLLKFFTLENGTDRLPQNVSAELPLCAV